MKFKLSGKTDSGVSKTYTAVTDENGEARFPSVFPGEYTLTEQFASTADLEKYTVTFSGDGMESTGSSVRIRLAPNQTAEMTVNCHNGMRRGEVKVVKSSYDGRKDGFTFRLYGESKYEGAVDRRATTDYSGVAWFVDVPVGTYTLEEVDIPDKYLSPQPQQVTVTEDSKGELAATAEFYNDKKDPQYGILRVKKTSDDNTVWGFKFHLYGIAEMESLGGDVIELVEIDEYAETDTYGNAYFKPVPVNGSYLLEEVEFPEQYEPQEPVDVSFINEETGEYVQEKTVRFHNSLKDGTVTVKKTADDGIVEGISFVLYSATTGGAQYEEIATTDATGTAVFTGVPLGTTLVLEEVLDGGKYRVEFTLEGNEEKIEAPMVEFDFTGTTTVYAHNKLPRGNVKIQKTSDDGILEGFRFRLYGESDSEGPVDRYAQTDETGAALFVNVPVGTYTVEEVDVPDRYETPEPVSVTVTEDHTAELPCTVSFRNRLRPGSITVWKYRGGTGAPAAGAEFLLEWSDDGVLWQEKQRLITGEDGYACFEGLEVSLYYRLTETKAPEGLQLMTAPVFEGKLPEENTDVSLEVVNNSLPTLPHTGKSGFSKWIPAASLGSVAACSAVFFHRRRKNENGGKEA